MADKKISSGIAGAVSIYNGMYGGGNGAVQTTPAEEESAEESTLRSGLDIIELSREPERGARQVAPESDSELLSLMEKSNEQIKASAEQFKKMYPETVAVPSTIGLSLKAASQRLKESGLGIRTVSQEYSETVAAGKIVLQVPGPGSSTTKQMGISVVISKGPSPDAKYGKDRNLLTLRYSNGKDDSGNPAVQVLAPGAEALITSAQIGQAAAQAAAAIASLESGSEG